MLQRRRIAVPESRELDLFAGMLERQGAITVRCPLVSMYDVEDPAPVNEWLRRLAAGRHDFVVLYTGEGLSRLLGFARRAGMESEVVSGLRTTRKVVRGPKPTKVLRNVGLRPDLVASEPTTAGLMETLAKVDLKGRCVGVQSYPGGRDTLTQFLSGAGAIEDLVLCYRYAPREEGQRVFDLVEEIISGSIDAIAFTSSPQVRRLREVARDAGKSEELDEAMRRTVVAAIGPVTAQTLESVGWRVMAVPSDSFHLKPLVNAIAEKFGITAQPDQ